MYRGWAQAAFLAELGSDVSPVDVGDHALVAVRGDGGIRVFDARCPHRGAHLGFGGRIDGAALVCAFHGHHIHLGASTGSPFHVREHRSLAAAGGLFVLPRQAPDTGAGSYLAGLDASHHIVPGFELEIAVPPEYVVENVFDADHFAAVHGLDGPPDLEARPGPSGSLLVEGVLKTPRPNKWQGDEQDWPAGTALRTRFFARVYSPYLVVTELGEPPDAHVVVTSATPTADGCLVRVTAAIPRSPRGGSTTVREIGSILNGSRVAFEQDAVVWEHLDPAAMPRWTPGDRAVRVFRDFCARFSATDGVSPT